MAAVLPGQAAESDRYASESGSPDLSFIYSKADLYRMAEAFGDSGRQAYVQSRLTFDFFWPIVYTLFFGTAISWLFLKAFALEGSAQRLNVIPVLGGMFDYLENAGAALVMTRFPEQTPLVDVLVPLFTFAKWLLVGGSSILLLIGIAAFLANALRSRSDL